jgi:hypothetical protein
MIFCPLAYLTFIFGKDQGMHVGKAKIRDFGFAYGLLALKIGR